LYGRVDGERAVEKISVLSDGVYGDREGVVGIYS
jgi:hypothetical protein